MAVFKGFPGLKGIVHPQINILSIFTHPHVVPNLYVFILGRYLEESFKSNRSQYVFFPTLVVNGE